MLLQKSEIVEVKPLNTFKKTYTGDYSVATFTLKVLSLENSIAGRIEDTMVISHTSIGKDKWKTKVTFKNIYDKTIRLSYQDKRIELRPQESFSDEFEYIEFGAPKTVRLEFIAFV